MVKKLRRMGMEILSVCLLAMLVTACGAPPENAFVGSWKCVSVTQYVNGSNVPGFTGKIPQVPEIDMTASINDHSSVVIKNGGKAVIRLKSDKTDQTIEGRWEFDASSPSELKVTDENGNVSIIHQKSENTIYIEDGKDLFGYRYSFSRK